MDYKREEIVEMSKKTYQVLFYQNIMYKYKLIVKPKTQCYDCFSKMVQAL
jgi:hypothetical protein